MRLGLLELFPRRVLMGMPPCHLASSPSVQLVHHLDLLTTRCVTTHFSPSWNSVHDCSLPWSSVTGGVATHRAKTHTRCHGPLQNSRHSGQSAGVVLRPHRATQLGKHNAQLATHFRGSSTTNVCFRLSCAGHRSARPWASHFTKSHDQLLSPLWSLLTSRSLPWPSSSASCSLTSFSCP